MSQTGHAKFLRLDMMPDIIVGTNVKNLNPHKASGPDKK